MNHIIFDSFQFSRMLIKEILMAFRLIWGNIFLALGLAITAHAQDYRWQQQVNYVMDIDMDVKNHQFTGLQQLTYTNNSPDTLNRVFYHLYFNAFQPGSMMDIRSRTIQDPDGRVRDRISKLSPEEIGYLRVSSLTQDGQPLEFATVGTILEVELDQPLLPKTIYPTGYGICWAGAAANSSVGT